jgi:hypothetical protein
VIYCEAILPNHTLVYCGPNGRFKFTQADYDSFELELVNFRSRSHSEIGEIIQAHLIVEYHLNLCLAACYRTMREEDAPRLTFQHKIALLLKWLSGSPGFAQE